MNLKKITAFIAQHHLLTLATCKDNIPYCANCFYAFKSDPFSFIIATDDATRHAKEALQNENIAGAIALETKEIGKIQGLQFCGLMQRANLGEKALYLATFPYALALNPTIWTLHVSYIKFTDNTLGFGKKLEFNFEV
ncbi:MAG: pyridoxamine 5'-phosphate oxidase family protein [Sulfurospirillum sp.]|nr:pyridoxamine 5'-phosphate oxidase family protein [Sulfurospirillum sp.]